MLNFSNRFEIYDNNNLGQVRALMDNNQNLWYVASDVCNMLGYLNPSVAVSSLPEHTKVLVNRKDIGIDVGKGNPALLLVNDEGLNSLILRSHSEKSEEVKNWLTSTVIPSIQENGGYIAGQEELSKEDLLEINQKTRAVFKETKEKLLKTRKWWHNAVQERNELKADNAHMKKELRCWKEEVSRIDQELSNAYDELDVQYQKIKLLQHQLDIATGAIKPYKEDAPVTYFVDQYGMVHFPTKEEEKDDRDDMDLEDR